MKGHDLHWILNMEPERVGTPGLREDEKDATGISTDKQVPRPRIQCCVWLALSILIRTGLTIDLCHRPIFFKGRASFPGCADVGIGKADLIQPM